MKTPGLHLLGHAVLLLAVLASSRGFGGIVQNGNFETPLAGEWIGDTFIPSGATPQPVRVPGTRTGGTGLWVLETSGRDDVRDGPMQGSLNSTSVKVALDPAPTGSGNGRTYTTRVWVKLDASAVEASVRCLLRWRDGGVNQVPLILAEAVITQPNVWIEVTGTATLAWTNSLSAATIDFEVEQIHKGGSPTPPPQWFPTYQIDDLQIAIDSDGDGLWDSQESSDHTQTVLPFTDSADSDGDRMTDDWELAQAPPLLPRDASDAALDPDGDGFTNLQEYFAATHPHDINSYPGKPCDPQATHLTRALLRYLALRPVSQTTLCGQMVTDNTTEYATYVSALATQTGRWPAMLGIPVEKMDAPLDIAASIDHAITYTNAGGIAQLKWAMWNPWTAQGYVLYQQIGTPGDLLKIDIPGLLDPTGTPTIAANTAQENLAARAVFIGWIDTVAAEIKRYNLATGSQPLLFRPLSEMNGGWFWWGHRTRADYLGLWNFIYNRLTGPASQGGHDLHNLIWVYESASSEHSHPGPTSSAAASDYYYPGDDRVDVMSHNLYDADWVLSWDANKVYSRYPKIYAVPQAGPEKTYPWRTGAFDNLTYPNRIAARFPRLSFFIVWNSFDGNQDDDNNSTTNSLNDDPNPAQLDDPHQHLAIIDNLNADQLMTDSRVITRDELRWHPPTFPSVTPTSSTALTASWTDSSPSGQNESGFRLEIAPSPAGPWSWVADTAADTTLATAAGLPAASTRWLRLRSLFPNGEDSLPTDALGATTWTLFGQWKNDHLGNVNAPDNSDDDGDGVPSALEYLFNTDPLSAASRAQPTASTLLLTDGNYLTLTFCRRSNAGGVTCTVQASSDLFNWQPDPVLTSAPIDNGDGTETVTYRDIVLLGTAPARFLQIQVSAP